jgi:hypothetical protein
MQDSESPPEKTSRGTRVSSSKWNWTIVAVVITIIFVGTSGYLLGSRNNQPTIRSVISPLPNQTVPTFVQLPISTPSQNPNSHPVATTFNPPTSWKTYKSEFRYQFSYPPTYELHPESNAPASSVSAPSTKYPDGFFTVERESGGVALCEKRMRWLLEDDPGMKEKEEIMISSYPAFQLEGKSRLGNDYEYDRNVVLVARENTCFLLDISSRNNPKQMTILKQILSTFKFTE